MKKLLFILLLFTFTFNACSRQAAISGEFFITKQNSVQKLAGKEVLLLQNNEIKYRQITDSEGRFSFTVLKGDYVLSAAHSEIEQIVLKTYKWNIPVSTKDNKKILLTEATITGFDSEWFSKN